MGSICNINTNPNTWPLLEQGHRLKPEYGSEDLVLVEYGTMDDDRDGPVPMTIHMRRSVYEKCLSGEYHAKLVRGMLKLRTSRGRYVKPLKPGFLY